MIPLIGFLPPTDPRVTGTVEAIRRELISGALVMRYRSESNVDGLPRAKESFCPAHSGWWTTSRLREGAMRRKTCLSTSPRSAMTLDCFPRSTILELVGCSAIFRKRLLTFRY